MNVEEIALEIAKELIRKSGVREWETPATRAAISEAAAEMADYLWWGNSPPDSEVGPMAVTAVFRVQAGTPKTIKNSGGNAAITLASLANGSMRQAATLDLGANWAQLWRIDTEFELAATPTAGTAVNLFASFSNSTGAGKGNTSGSDAAYAGYSSNAAASVKQLELIGAHICTTQATATVQKAHAGTFMPKGRYMNLVVDDESGAAFHSTDTNQVITLTPLEGSSEPS